MYKNLKRDPSQNNDDNESGGVSIISRDKRIIYAYGDVGADMVSDLFSQLSRFSSKTDPILLLVNSGGGNLTDGFAMVDLIRASKAPVYSLVAGQCCSAATFFACSCDKRYAFPHSFFLIHELFESPSGERKFNELIEEARISKCMMHQMWMLYTKATGVSLSQIKTDLSESRWLSAKEACAYGPKGLIDEIVTTIPSPFDKAVKKNKGVRVKK